MAVIHLTSGKEIEVDGTAQAVSDHLLTSSENVPKFKLAKQTADVFVFADRVTHVSDTPDYGRASSPG